MLVLSRKPHEARPDQSDISIGNDIVVRVVRIRGNDVTVGIEAPRDLKISRGRVLDEKRKGAT